jgi:hypothetical protein
MSDELSAADLDVIEARYRRGYLSSNPEIAFAPMADLPALMDEVRRLQAERDELRAVLAPLLDDPWREAEDGFYDCTFCRPNGRTYDHKPGCPVLACDRLLGRPTSEEGTP